MTSTRTIDPVRLAVWVGVMGLEVSHATRMKTMPAVQRRPYGLAYLPITRHTSWKHAAFRARALALCAAVGQLVAHRSRTGGRATTILPEPPKERTVPMLMQILTHTPRWIFVLFFALLVFGVQQLAAREGSLRRVSLLPVAMVAFSLFGTASSFTERPIRLLGWLVGLAVCAALIVARPPPPGTRFDPATRRFALPGSAVPLALMMGIFLTRYAVGIALAIVPQLARDTRFVLPMSVVFGAFSGLFLGRAARLWKLAAATPSAPAFVAAAEQG